MGTIILACMNFFEAILKCEEIKKGTFNIIIWLNETLFTF